jgi:type III secretory pathway lipoprotein EscJ
VICYREHVRALALLVLVACAPTIDGPIDQQRARDAVDAARVSTQLAALPGAVRADVTLHRAVTDPLGSSQPASAAVLIVVDDRADRAAIERTTRALLHGTAPEIADAQIAVEVGAVRPTLAKVGPFTVEATTRPRLVALLAVLLAIVAGLAGWIAWRERPTP